MKSKILITGGAGFLGSELTKLLLDQSYEITVYDNLLYDKTSLLGCCKYPKFSFIEGDVRNISELQSAMEKIDIIIPLAALVGAPLCDKNYEEAKQVNWIANKYIAENKSKNQIIIYPCTNSGYGINSSEVCTEETPINPISWYGKTKVLAEQIYQQTENCITMRLATVFGVSARMRTDLLINNLVWRATKDKVLVMYQSEFMRNYIHIQDICRAFLFIIQNWDMCKNETFNVGNDSLNMSKMQLAEKIKEHLPKTEIIHDCRFF